MSGLLRVSTFKGVDCGDTNSHLELGSGGSSVAEDAELGSCQSAATDLGKDVQPGEPLCSSSNCAHCHSLAVAPKPARRLLSCERKVNRLTVHGFYSEPLRWLTGVDSSLADAPIYGRIFPPGAGHVTPLEAGFTLSRGSGGSNPAADVVLRLEAETNEETKVSPASAAACPTWCPSS